MIIRCQNRSNQNEESNLCARIYEIEIKMWMFIIVILLGYFIFDWLKRKLKISGITQKYVFITGCDTGFGYLLAQELDGLGFHVIAACLTSQGMEDLKTKCSSRLHTVQLNVVSEKAVHDVIQHIKTLLPPDTGLWAVVNNAGIGGALGPIECLTRKDYIDILNINLFGVIDVTKACIPLLRKSRGRVINIASMFGRISSSPTPYCISKYGVEAFSDSLRREVYYQGITVHILEPGYFKTNIINKEAVHKRFQDTFNQGSDECKTYYGKDYISETEKVIDAILSKANSNLREVVDAYQHAITARYPKYRYAIGRDVIFVARLLWTIPEWASDYIICSLMSRAKGTK